MPVYLLIDLPDKIKSIYGLKFNSRGTKINQGEYKGNVQFMLTYFIPGISLEQKFTAQKCEKIMLMSIFCQSWVTSPYSY